MPEHESMQDYIDIIDESGLLNNKQEDLPVEEPVPEKVPVVVGKPVNNFSTQPQQI